MTHNDSQGGKIIRGAVGFMGPEGSVKNPSYEAVCTGATGHVEVYDCDYDVIDDAPKDVTYESLIKHFFMFHDPTTLNRQGNDAGTQYASVIFCHDNVQLEIATRVKEELQALVDAGKVKYSGPTVSTAVVPATTFYPAEAYHQAYLENNPGGYCNHRMRFKAWPSALPPPDL
mmetsp:Transcript_96390/g.274740  ORF Transcript_96390/g.274740 Transcript_96390/m.274740 type:complete len:173 (+) Transcript_96390:205-723(+)